MVGKCVHFRCYIVRQKIMEINCIQIQGAKCIVSSEYIPLVDLRAQYLALKPEIMLAFEEVLEGMQLFMGPRQRAFEQEFATYCGCRYGVGTSSGTTALELALR